MDILLNFYTFLFAANAYLALPSMLLFFGTALFLTVKTGFPQIRAFPRFIQLLKGGVQRGDTSARTISPFHALFSAMSTTIGMGNVVGPSMAIGLGGPGALFWLLLYIVFGSVTKFTEVSFAVYSRKTSARGDIIGGPTQYLSMVSPGLGKWYALLTIFLFIGWSGIQVNTLASIWAQEGVPLWVSGLVAVVILLVVVLGGVQRIGYFASRTVPLKFFTYFFFAVLILLQDIPALWAALRSVFSCAFSVHAGCGGLTGITLFTVMREGIYKSIFITEAGLGTASIPHALANVEHPTDQGILALYSGVADILLCLLSGLLTLVTGVWLSGKLSNTLIYEAFKMHSPIAGGQYVLMFSILLFVITALIGNTYNGSISFASFTNYRYIKTFYLIAAGIAFFGAFLAVPVIWSIMDIMLTLVAIPNLIGIIYLAIKYPDIIKY